jgi:small subunit ribosomal protein S21
LVFVAVTDNDIAKALKALKYKLQRQGVFKELRTHRYYEKPSDARRRQHQAAIRGERRSRRRAIISGDMPSPIKRKAVK